MKSKRFEQYLVRIWRMDGGFQYLDLIVIGLIAVFILLRLTNKLGSTEGHIPTRERPEDAEDTQADDNVVRLPRSEPAEAPSQNPAMDIPAGVFASGPAREGLEAIAKTDRSFTVASFVDGAQWAHGEISTAFASGDRDALRSLLSPELFKNFDAALAEREATGESLERELVRLHSSDILSADLVDRMAEVTVKFVSDQIDTYKDADGMPLDIEENGELREVVDVWTFSRNIKSNDPTWTLIETQAED